MHTKIETPISIEIHNPALPEGSWELGTTRPCAVDPKSEIRIRRAGERWFKIEITESPARKSQPRENDFFKTIINEFTYNG